MIGTRGFRTIMIEELRRGSGRISFRITTAAVPVLLLILSIAVPIVRNAISDDEGDDAASDADIALADESGMLTEDDIAQAGLLPFATRDAGVDCLSNGDVKSLYVVSGHYATTGNVEWFYTQSFVAAGFSRDKNSVIDPLRSGVIGDALDSQISARFIDPAQFTSTVVTDDSSTKEGVEQARILSASYLFMILMAVGVMSVGD
ncbi:MAG: hypothetical protein QF909_16110 [SAR202 cluster bacterium]|nr:hypothetical protein [SAR202 cluster bacterium]